VITGRYRKAKEATESDKIAKFERVKEKSWRSASHPLTAWPRCRNGPNLVGAQFMSQPSILAQPYRERQEHKITLGRKLMVEAVLDGDLRQNRSALHGKEQGRATSYGGQISADSGVTRWKAKQKTIRIKHVNVYKSNDKIHLPRGMPLTTAGEAFEMLPSGTMESVDLLPA
jgi:hypothetical protein